MSKHTNPTPFRPSVFSGPRTIRHGVFVPVDPPAPKVPKVDYAAMSRDALRVVAREMGVPNMTEARRTKATLLAAITAHQAANA